MFTFVYWTFIRRSMIIRQEGETEERDEPSEEQEAREHWNYLLVLVSFLAELEWMECLEWKRKDGTSGLPPETLLRSSDSCCRPWCQRDGLVRVVGTRNDHMSEKACDAHREPLACVHEGIEKVDPDLGKENGWILVIQSEAHTWLELWMSFMLLMIPFILFLMSDAISVALSKLASVFWSSNVIWFSRSSSSSRN